MIGLGYSSILGSHSTKGLITPWNGLVLLMSVNIKGRIGFLKLWCIYPSGQLNSVPSLPLLKGREEENMMRKDSGAEMRTGRSLNNYHHRQNNLKILINVNYYTITNNLEK